MANARYMMIKSIMEARLEHPVTKADLEAALDRQLRKLTRRFALIGAAAAMLFVLILEVTR